MTPDNADTRLAAWRKRRGMSQSEVARLTGLPRSTYWRLEKGRYENPPLRYLVNCAIALECPEGVLDVVEPEWLTWFDFHFAAPDPSP